MHSNHRLLELQKSALKVIISKKVPQWKVALKEQFKQDQQNLILLKLGIAYKMDKFI